MRRAIAVVACLTVLMFVGGSSALAKGPHHGGNHGHGHGHGHGNHHQVQRWNHNSFRGPNWGSHYCAPQPYVAAYPIYPAYPVAPAYPRLGFGLGGSNFSFWYQQ